MPVSEGSPAPLPPRVRRAPRGTLGFYGFLLVGAFVAAIVGQAIDFGPFPAALNDLIRYGLIALVGGTLGGALGGIGMGLLSTGRVRAGMLLSAVLGGAVLAGLIAFLFATPRGLSCAGAAAAWGGLWSAVVYAARSG
jgi:hypothetical protein